MATAETKAIEMRGQAIAKNPEVLKLETITKWSGAVPNFASGENGRIVPIFDVMSLQKTKDTVHQKQ